MESQIEDTAGQRAIALALLWLSGACLRLTVLAVPPVVPLLHADLHLSETDIGWLSSLPPMLFAIAAVPGVAADRALRHRAGAWWWACCSMPSVRRRARAIPDPAFLYASTIVMAAGVSIMQPALPPLGARLVSARASALPPRSIRTAS